MKILKSFLAFILSGMLVFPLFSYCSFAEEGTPVSTYAEFLAIADNLNGNYYLTNDIVVSDSDKVLTPMGDAVKQFKGVLDGRNYSVKGLKIAATTFNSTKIGGIFAYNGGTVKNLKIEDVKVTSSNEKYAYTGVIAGVNLGTVSNCLVSGNIAVNKISIAQYTGSVCGQMLNGSIISCVSYANIYAENGEIYAGGISGYNERGKVNSCAVYSSIFADAEDDDCNIYCGGITGYARDESEFTDCLYNGGIIAEKCSNAYIGGVSGVNSGKINRFISLGTYLTSDVFSHIYAGAAAGDDFTAKVSDVYYAANSLPSGFTGKSGTKIAQKDISDTNSYQNFDFHNIWAMSDGVPYIKVLLTQSTAQNETLQGIKIKSKPTKTTYKLGETPLDLSGIKVYAVYPQKEVLLMQNDYSFGGFNPQKSGKQTITVNYKGFKDTFTVTVTKKSDNAVGTASDFSGYINGNGKNENIPNITVNSDSTSAPTAEQKPATVNSGTVGTDNNSGESSSQTDKTNTSSSQNFGNNIVVLDTLSEYSPVSAYYSGGASVLPLAVIIASVIVLAGAAFVVVFVILRKSHGKADENTAESDENRSESGI